jgi:hypothetical protein
MVAVYEQVMILTFDGIDRRDRILSSPRVRMLE